MAARPVKAENPYQKLARVAQRYGKALGTPEEAAEPGSSTEFERLRARAKAADDACRDDLLEAAREAAADAERARARLQERIAALHVERSNVDLRRNEFAEAAAEYDWRMEHRQDRDFIGPFSLEHRRDQSVLKLGSCKVAVCELPSGVEMFERLRLERQRLEHAAQEIWPELKDKLLALQTGSDQAVAWPKIVDALTTDKIPFRKREPAVLFALSWLRVGGIEPGWRVWTAPPTLSRQNKKDSVDLPRIDRPGNPERICAVRLESPTGATPPSP